jgi:hypothetical protein
MPGGKDNTPSPLTQEQLGQRRPCFRRIKKVWIAGRTSAHVRRELQWPDAPECRRLSIVNQGGKMSRIIITIPRFRRSAGLVYQC